MLILGIDPGTAITGYGLVEQIDELRLVDAGAILTPAGTPLPERLLTIHKQLSSLISSFKPDAVAVVGGHGVEVGDVERHGAHRGVGCEEFGHVHPNVVVATSIPESPSARQARRG